MLNFEQSLVGVSSKPLLLDLYNRRVKDPERIIGLLVNKTMENYQSAGVEVEDRDGIEVYYEVRFMTLLKQYLRGSGHPSHRALEGFIYPSDPVLDSPPPVLRANMFLLAISGFALVPPTGQDLYVSLEQCALQTKLETDHFSFRFSSSIIRNSQTIKLDWMCSRFANRILFLVQH